MDSQLPQKSTSMPELPKYSSVLLKPISGKILVLIGVPILVATTLLHYLSDPTSLWNAGAFFIGVPLGGIIVGIGIVRIVLKSKNTEGAGLDKEISKADVLSWVLPVIILIVGSFAINNSATLRGIPKKLSLPGYAIIFIWAICFFVLKRLMFAVRKYTSIKVTKIIILILLLASAAYGGYWYVKIRGQCTSPDPIDCGHLISDQEIIDKLKTNWHSIQGAIPFRPGHPLTTAWGLFSFQLLPGGILLVEFEDGYNPGIAVLRLDFVSDQFKILETFQNQGDFTLSEWQNLLKKYGDSSYTVSTYTMDLVRNKEIVSYQDFTKVPENIFVKDYFLQQDSNTSTWKTYTNTKYGFEFKYPSEYQTSSVSICGNQFKDSKIFINSPERISVVQSVRDKSPEGCTDDINFSVYPTSQIGGLQNYSMLQAYRGGSTAISIDGVSGYELITHGFGTYYTIMLEKDGQIYEILFGNSVNRESLTSIEKGILSTFKFVEPGTVTKNGVYENQYLKVAIPAGWTATQATQTVYYGSCAGYKTDCTDTPKVESKAGAVDITKGNYTLHIDAQASQASGIQGGRLSEITPSGSSVDAVLIDPGQGPCGFSENHPATTGHERVDMYVDEASVRDRPQCVSSKGLTSWYFSYITTDAEKGYFNYYHGKDIPADYSYMGYVITMSYNSKDVNKLPIKGSTELKSMLSEMTNILRTFESKHI